MPQQIYSKGSIFIKSVLIAEAQEIEVDYDNGASDVDTIEKGLAGASPGPLKSTIRLVSAVPAAGLDLDYVQSLVDLEIVDVVVFARGKKLKWEGTFRQAKESYGVSGPSKFDATLRCGPPDISVL